MSIFSAQIVYCQSCGIQFGTTFQEYRGSVCSEECFFQLRWKKDLSVMGKLYRPMPEIKNGKYVKRGEKND